MDVYSAWWPSGEKFTRLDFIHDGRMYYRNIRDFYQPRYLVTLARRFAQEVALGGVDTGGGS